MKGFRRLEMMTERRKAGEGQIPKSKSIIQPKTSRQVPCTSHRRGSSAVRLFSVAPLASERRHPLHAECRPRTPREGWRDGSPFYSHRPDSNKPLDFVHPRADLVTRLFRKDTWRQPGSLPGETRSFSRFCSTGQKTGTTTRSPLEVVALPGLSRDTDTYRRTPYPLSAPCCYGYC